MNFFYRITILFLWMIGIAVSSYAGIKKCTRVSTKAKSAYVLISVTEKQSPVNSAASKTNTTTAGVCANAFVLEQQQEEPFVAPMQEKTKFAPLAALHFQEYINQPFSPPRIY